MGKVFAICGKICSGKSYYSRQLEEKERAIILSCDEVTSVLFDNNLGDSFDEMSKRIQKYLLQKSVDIVNAGGNVILDWGFWNLKVRNEVKNFFKAKNIDCQWHYIDIDDKSWQKNIDERNERVLQGKGGADFYLDEGLMKKLQSSWEEPKADEIDVWYKFSRD